MTPEKYDDWSRYHADLFNLRDPSDARLFQLWASVLMLFDFEELRDASIVVATDPSDKRRFRENHLSMLREVIVAKRADAAARDRDRLDRQHAGADCSDCFGVGIVRVPHPEFVVDGAQERPFFIGVACACQVGISRFNTITRRLAEAQTVERFLSLEQYEALVPDWRHILAVAGEAQVREFEAADLARTVDRIAPIDATLIKKTTDRGHS